MLKPLKKIKPFDARKLYVVAILFAFLLAGVGVAAHQGVVANAASCSKASAGNTNVGNGLVSREGYFTNCAQVTSWGGSSFVITSGVMTATTSIAGDVTSQNVAKGQFISQIESYYHETNGADTAPNKVRDALGAAFVIDTIRGIFPHGSPSLSPSDLTDFENRINSSGVVMSIFGTANTGCPTAANNLAEYRPLISGASYAAVVNGSNSGGDVAFDSGSNIVAGGNCRSIVFKNSAGTILYQLRELCANTFGNIPNAGLPYAPYSLAPNIVVNPAIAEPGTDVQVAPSVDNTGGGSSTGTTWQISTFNLPAGAAVPGPYSGPLNLNPCAYVATQSGTGCQVEGGNAPDGSTGVGNYATGSPAAFASSSGSDWGVKTRSVSNSLGSRVCYMLSVVAVSNVSGNWAHSAAACVLVSLKPKVQIIGDDLRVGAAFVGGTPSVSTVLTSLTIKTNKSYGSWDEYGIAASGTVTGAASGSALAGGLACVGSTCQTNTLTFANESSPIGNYVSSSTIPDVAGSFQVSGSTPPYVNLGDTALQRVETGTGNLIVGGGTILKGQWLVINAPTATVTITGDINYDPSALSSISDIPQLVIIANQINIAGNVKNIDAWLIASGASGTINTCSDVDVTAPLTADICNNQLVVNGPVMAKKLYLRRTYPPNTTTLGDPAEIFNLRPDAYLWATFQASKSARLETTYSQELPPRF